MTTQTSLYSWTKNKVLSPYVKSPCHKVQHFLFNEAIWHKHWEEDIGLPGLPLQSSCYNCLLLIPQRQLGTYFLPTGQSYSQHIQKSVYKSMFDMYQQVHHSPIPMAACLMECWHQSVVVIYVEKQCLARVKTLAQSSAYRMDTRETPATKASNATPPQRVQRHMYLSNN